ncbi:MAG: pyrroline-5-carboxylate reductase [Dehalococcoidia bacterium]|nr:pyrroline-5-carboxylate reductase [Dehalococcoidia bacterium]
MKIAFIGGGVMAEAMLSAALAKQVITQHDVAIGEPVEARRRDLNQRYGVATSQSNTQACSGAEVVVLSVKPQWLAPVLQELRGTLKPAQVVLSIVAGAPIQRLTQGLNHQAVVRVMPNTPAQVGAGMSVWTATPQVSEQQKDAARRLVRSFGEEVYVSNEQYVDMATALSASGPAFVFVFLEALIDAGVHIGLPRELAQMLAYQTVAGSVEMARKTGKHPAELRNMVTSSGGTTAEGLLALNEGKLPATVVRAVIAAFEKAKKLAEPS